MLGFDLKAQSNQSYVHPHRLTLVQICERLVMQLDGGRCGSAQHILEWGVFGLVFRRKTGFLLLKDWQSQHVAERDQRGQKTDKSTRRKHKNLYLEQSLRRRVRQKPMSSFKAHVLKNKPIFELCNNVLTCYSYQG